MAIKICPCCGENFQPHHKVPNQTYCSAPECQKERRQSWDNKQQKSDPDYRDNKSRAQKNWAERNPDYWRKYRKSNSGPKEKTVPSLRQTQVIAPSPVKMDDLAGLSQCWYVLGCDRSGYPIAKPNEIPVECGVMVFQNNQFEVTRMAPKRTVSQLPFGVWMELAKATPRRRSDLENPQVALTMH